MNIFKNKLSRLYIEQNNTFQIHMYTMLSNEELFRTSVFEKSAVYVSGIKRLFLHETQFQFPD